MQVKAKKKKEEKKPQKAMDAGARGRRMLQRREYRAKVSEFIPKELEDQFSHDENGQLVFELDLKKAASKLKTGLKNWWNKPIMKDTPTQKQYKDAVQSGNSTQYQSYEPEGEMIEANSEQMKAMHDAKMKKKEDDKVAAKKKGVKEESELERIQAAIKSGMMNGKKLTPEQIQGLKAGLTQGGNKVDEGTKYGLYKGSGKASGAFKDYLDKKKKENKKKKVDEACWKGYEKKGMKTMFGKRYPNCVKKTKKEEVEVAEDMKGMSQKSGDKRSTESGAGMTAQGVAKYNRRTGGNLKTAVTTPPSKLKPGSKAAKRRKSFCARSKSWTGPRGKAARRRWNCSYEPELPMIIDEKKKLFNTAPLSNRVSNWSKKINEGDVYVKSNRNRLTGLPNLGKGDKKSKEEKITGVNYATMAQSYEPQGELIQEMPTDIKNVVKGGLSSAKDQFLDTGKVNVKSTLKNTLKNALQTKTVTDFLKQEGYGDVPFRDGRVKNYLGKDNIKDIKLTQKGQQAFKTIPDPIIRSGNKVINPPNPVTKMYKSLDRVNSSYEPQGELVEMGRKGKGAINSDVLKNNPNLDPTKPGDYIKLKRLSAKVKPIDERKMTSAEKDKKEKYVKGMKKVKGDFTKRYGKDGKSVMYATATKMAMKEESCGKGEYYCYDDKKCKPIPEGMKVGKDGMLVKEDFYKKKYDVRKGGYQKTNKMTKSNKRSGDSKAQYRQVHKDLAKENALIDKIKNDFNFIKKAKDTVNKYNQKLKKNNDAINKVMPGSATLNNEGSLHKWFKGSKSKDGKPGWVNVVTGGTCASDKPGEGTPKCVSSSKRASMTKAERLSASRRKKKADPGQQSKSGAAKPTYVATDKKKK